MNTASTPIALNRTAGLLLWFVLAQAALAGELGLTIYNQNFAVVRDTVPLDLKPGSNQGRRASLPLGNLGNHQEIG